MIQIDEKPPSSHSLLGKISNYFLVYSPFFNKMRYFKDRLFYPILRCCVQYHISPELLSIIGLAFGLLSLIAFLQLGYWYFVILMSISLIFDFIDGSLARYKQSASNFGKYLDFAIDHLLMLLMALSLCYYLNNFYWMLSTIFFSIVLYINIIAYAPLHIPSGRITLFIPCLFAVPQLGLLLLALYGIILTIIMLIDSAS